MSLPRILTLDKDQRLIQSPAPELAKLRGKQHVVSNLRLKGEEKPLDGIAGDTLEILAEFEAADADAEAFGVRVRRSDDGKDAITIRYAGTVLNVAGTEVPLKLEGGSRRLRLHVFLDKSVLELFINDGAASVTRVEYPGEKDLGVSVFAEGGSVTLKSLDAWEMSSIW